MTDEYTLLPNERGYRLSIPVANASASCWDGVLCNVTGNVTEGAGDFGSGFMIFPNVTGIIHETLLI